MPLFLMLATLFGGALVAVALVRSLWLKDPHTAKRLLAGLAAWAAVYGVLLVSASARSRTSIIPAGEAKAFCGFYLDCHIHAAVEKVERRGNQLIVDVKIFSDARRAELNYFLRAELMGAGAGHILRGSLPPSGSTTQRLTFNLDGNAQNLRLSVTDASWLDRLVETFLIGDEDSIFHARRLFALT